MVLIASFEYASYSNRVTTFPRAEWVSPQGVSHLRLPLKEFRVVPSNSINRGATNRYRRRDLTDECSNGSCSVIFDETDDFLDVQIRIGKNTNSLRYFESSFCRRSGYGWGSHGSSYRGTRAALRHTMSPDIGNQTAAASAGAAIPALSP